MINTNDKSQTWFDFLEELIKYEQEKLRVQLDVLASKYQVLLNTTGKLFELSAVLTVNLRRLEDNRVMVADEVDNI